MNTIILPTPLLTQRIAYLTNTNTKTIPPKKKNKGNVEDDPFDFEALSSMKQVTPTKPAGNRIDVEVTQAASERVLVVSCKKARIKIGIEASFTHRVYGAIASGKLSLPKGTKLIGQVLTLL